MLKVIERIRLVWDQISSEIIFKSWRKLLLTEHDFTDTVVLITVTENFIEQVAVLN